jgi:hypothetical protein
MQELRETKLNLPPTKAAVLWPIVLITLGFLSFTCYKYVNMERAAIMANWPEHRCNPLIMAIAYFMKPEIDPQSPGEFAANNFKFCSTGLVQEVMRIAMTPVTFVTNQQAVATNTITKALNRVKEIIKKMMDEFMSFLDPFFKKFNDITFQVGIVFQKLKSAFQKANATLISTVFIGLSFISTMQNMINLTIKIIFIILDIMIAIIVILFFVLWPLIPFVIIPVINAISSMGGSRGGGAEERRGPFCFVPETDVVLETGETRRIDAIQLGDRLQNGVTVEGILKLDGTQTPLFVLEGIQVSGSHLVKGNKGWHSVAEDPRATPLIYRVPVLYCLNTSNQTIPLRSEKGVLLFRDWEEIDDNDTAGQEGWNRLVAKQLGTVIPSSAPDTFCLMDPAMPVPTVQGMKPLQELRIGDEIELSYNRSTRVLGIVEGHVFGRGHPGWMSSCIQKITTATYARRTTILHSTEPLHGRHIITESGRLLVSLQGKMIELRDFTEVGVDGLAATYPFVKSRLAQMK